MLPSMQLDTRLSELFSEQSWYILLPLPRPRSLMLCITYSLLILTKVDRREV